MKTISFAAFAAAALSFAPGSLYAVDPITAQGVQNDKQLQQELSGTTGLAPLERSGTGALMQGVFVLPRGNFLQPNGAILGDDGSERLLENTDRFSIQSGVQPTESLPPNGTLGSKVEPKVNEPTFPPDDTEDFQD